MERLYLLLMIVRHLANAGFTRLIKRANYISFVYHPDEDDAYTYTTVQLWPDKNEVRVHKVRGHEPDLDHCVTYGIQHAYVKWVDEPQQEIQSMMYLMGNMDLYGVSCTPMKHKGVTYYVISKLNDGACASNRVYILDYTGEMVHQADEYADAATIFHWWTQDNGIV